MARKIQFVMTDEQFVKLIEAFSTLIGALGWPLLVLFILLYFGTPLKKFLSDVGEFTFKAGTSGLEATAKRQQIEAAALLGAASARSDPSAEKSPTSEVKGRDIADIVSHAINPQALRRLSEASVLWVDDNPSNNIYERKALETLGIRFTLSLDTTDALERIRMNKYDVIISDMGRAGDQTAGYILLDEKKKIKDTTPVIFYTSRASTNLKQEARSKGAVSQTNDPQELFSLVLGVIQTERSLANESYRE